MNLLTRLFTGILLFFMSIPAMAITPQKNTNPQEEEAAYTQVITQRAAKIVATLNISDSIKANRVTDIIANQYRNIKKLDESRDAELKTIKTDTIKSKTEKETLTKSIEEKFNKNRTQLHKEYLSLLSKELSSEQIDKVKDGMTYGKVKFTYDGYIQEVPSLTDVQKKQILDFLIQAREEAIDAGSSNKKSEIFKKYKGRIANYLTSQGYDMKKERTEWGKR
ncbi:MAG: DUF3826 domain-containing protein, partial [Bacteroidota bacterium]|nr:DUF3826 domain-containing protein [Bacteroidota bacterium]